MNESTLFWVTNKHVADSGTAPQIDGNAPNRYHSYFENEYGEQLIFVYDYGNNTGLLYHGDVGWEHPQTVEDGNAPNVVLNEAELLWLKACWLAVTSLRGRE